MLMLIYLRKIIRTAFPKSLLNILLIGKSSLFQVHIGCWE